MRILTAMFIVLLALVGAAQAAYLSGDRCLGKATIAADQEAVYASQVAGPASGPVPAAVVTCPERSFGWQERISGREVRPEASGASGPGAGG